MRQDQGATLENPDETSGKRMMFAKGVLYAVRFFVNTLQDLEHDDEDYDELIRQTEVIINELTRE